MNFPARIDRKSHRENAGKRCLAHRNFVRSHACCACGSQVAIEVAHVRSGTGGGMGVKPSDRWCISLCRDCHAEQHRMGEGPFADKHKIDLISLCGEFVKRSPKRPLLEQMP